MEAYEQTAFSHDSYPSSRVINIKMGFGLFRVNFPCWLLLKMRKTKHTACYALYVNNISPTYIKQLEQPNWEKNPDIKFSKMGSHPLPALLLLRPCYR